MNPEDVIFDDRWIGEHGIGRFASKTAATIPHCSIDIAGHPADAFDSLRLTLALRKHDGSHVFFSPGYNAPLFAKIPFVFTVHDLNHVDRPENSNVFKRLYYALVLKRGCHKAAYVLTPSEFSRKRISDWSGISPGKVIVVGNGVDPIFRPDAEPYPVDYPYLLSVSNRKGHKNERRTVEAFARAGLTSEIRLLFTGGVSAELSACIRKYGLGERVVFTGIVAENDLPSLYKSAIALVFPSLYEGFGLPVVESMACGTPVITSQTSSLPEIAGNAALLVNPESVDEIATAIGQVVRDSRLRDELRRRGLQRAAGFTWEETSAKVRRVLERAMKASPPACTSS